MKSKRKLKVSVKKENPPKDELNKCLYEYGMKQLEQELERKYHLEVKSLYVLQGSAILITLFLGLLNSKIELIEVYSKWLNVLQYVFYVSIFLTIIILLLSLEDTIGVWYKKFKKKDDEEKEKDEKTDGGKKDKKKNEDSLFQKLLKPDFIMKIETCTSGFFENIIVDISTSIRSLEDIILAKYCCFKWGLRCFIFSIFVLVVMGILIA